MLRKWWGSKWSLQPSERNLKQKSESPTLKKDIPAGSCQSPACAKCQVSRWGNVRLLKAANWLLWQRKVDSFERSDFKARVEILMSRGVTYCDCVYGVPDTVTLMCEHWAVSRTSRCATAMWTTGLLCSADNKYNTDSLTERLQRFKMGEKEKGEWFVQFPAWELK